MSQDELMGLFLLIIAAVATGSLISRFICWIAANIWQAFWSVLFSRKSIVAKE